MNAQTVSAEELAIQQQAWAYFASVFNDLPEMELVLALRERAHQATTDGSSAEYLSWMDNLSDEEILTALGRDRARLFRHVDESCITPPYESLYTGETEDSVLQALHAFFVENGFAPTGDYREAADYLGMELAFLVECCNQELKALSENNVAEAEKMHAVRDAFLHNHIFLWAGAYAREMFDAAQTGFYQEGASLLLATLGEDVR